jgi:hypothetical protein
LRASSPVIHLLSPDGKAILPSIDSASFNVMRGRPSCWRVSHPDSESAAAFRPMPTFTSTPASRSFSIPFPEVRLSGSFNAIRTRAGLAFARRSAQAGPRGLS